jgi:hypothetical protein
MSYRARGQRIASYITYIHTYMYIHKYGDFPVYMIHVGLTSARPTQQSVATIEASIHGGN